MKLIVIGAAGFIGTELTAAACSAGHLVYGFDVASSAPEKMNNTCNYEYRRVSDGDDESIFPDGADCMVILAAKRPYSGFCFEDYLDNIKTFERYFDIAVRKKVNSVVFASSKAVYSGNSIPFKECGASVPSSLYGASKLACEQLGLLAARQHGIGFISLRFAQVIGYGERKGYLIGTLIDNAVEKRTQIIYGDGSQRRHYVYVKDAVRSILCAAERRDICGSFNIGMSSALSNLELAESANRMFGNENNLRHDYDMEMSVNNDEMDIRLAKEVLNFSAAYDIDSSFRDIAAEAGR